MNDNFPIPIFSEKDLAVYENYINSAEFKRQSNNFTSHLNSLVGQIIRVDIAIGNRLITRQGRLISVNEDFITLKPPQSRGSIIIKTDAMKFLSVP